MIGMCNRIDPFFAGQRELNLQQVRYEAIHVECHTSKWRSMDQLAGSLTCIITNISAINKNMAQCPDFKEICEVLKKTECIISM